MLPRQKAHVSCHHPVKTATARRLWKGQPNPYQSELWPQHAERTALSLSLVEFGHALGRLAGLRAPLPGSVYKDAMTACRQVARLLGNTWQAREHASNYFHAQT